MMSIDSFVIELQKSISLFKPETALVVALLIAIMADLIFRKSKNVSGVIALAGFVVAGAFMTCQCNQGANAFSKMLAVDPFAMYFKWIILISSFVVVVISFFSDELYKEHRRLGEYFTLILGMTFGMFLLAGATNLVMIYLAIETMSISSYILTGFTKEVKRSSEASLKYVIFGAVSSGIMIYGISILYGLTGTLNLYEINIALAKGGINIFALVLSSIMIFAGFGYKISAVPFHFWTPDVYEGAPITITALLSVASKAAGFAVLIRFIKVGFIDSQAVQTQAWHLMAGVDWKLLMAILAVLTMTLGNLSALWQNNVKRMLAYSSIAHAGYMLMAVTVMTDTGLAAVALYFIMYLFMNLGAFYVVMLFANKIGSEDVDDYNGLGTRAPLLAVCLSIFLISLTGIPPTAGYIGKLYLFTAVLNSNLVWLAVIGVLNSVISLVYYARLIRNMFLRGNDTNKEKLSYSPAAIVILVVLTIPTLFYGLFFGPLLKWASTAAVIFLK